MNDPDLQTLGLITSSGRIDGFRLTSLIRDLLLESRPQEARALLESLVRDGLLSSDHYRVNNGLSLVKSVEKHLDRVVTKMSADNCEEVSLSPAPVEAEAGLPRAFSSISAAGVFTNEVMNYPVGSPETTMQAARQEDQDILKSAGFARETPTFEADRCFVALECRFSAFSGDAALAFWKDESGDYVYRADRSGRVAKASRLTAAHVPVSEVSEGLVLAFPHSSSNYYHSLFEAAYGLRLASRLSSDCPIFHEDDRFGLLAPLAAALGVDPGRLVPTSKARDLVIAKAYLPDINPFYGSTQLFNWFRRVGENIWRPTAARDSGKRLYISRRGSSRSPDYEPELERLLVSLKFECVRLEQLSVPEQASLFRSASVVVAHHGAGLANLAFAGEGIAVIELFPPAIVSPDFAIRARFVTDRYVPIVMRGRDDIYFCLQAIAEAL